MQDLEIENLEEPSNRVRPVTASMQMQVVLNWV